MTRYMPEIGQAIFGNPMGAYDSPDYVDALVDALLSEIRRVFWNAHQRQWDGYDDPGIPGIEFRPYWWGGDEEPEAALPNLKHGDVEVRWYKHPGRGQSLNIEPTPERMVSWFDSALATIRAAGLEDP